MKRFRVLLIVLVVVSACGVMAANACDMETYLASVDPLLQEWEDVIAMADQTPRMSLPGVIADMQTVKREMARVDAPACFATEHSFLLKSFDFAIDGFLAFLGQEDDSVVAGKFEKASKRFDWWLDAVEEKE